MRMHFTKMEGLGNDYVYVNCFTERVDDPQSLTIRISDRHFGIGSDGLILIRPSMRADFTMEMYNADGSEGAMCGNGIRCVGKYVYDYGLTDKRELAVETGAGIRSLKLTVDERTNKVTDVTVHMGKPVVSPHVNLPIQAAGAEYYVTCLSMGNPHCVLFVPDVESLRLEEIGPCFEHHTMFPDRVNTEFVQVIDENLIKMRVWERGSGETLACGTGACAAAVAGVLNGRTKEHVKVLLPGGTLVTQWDRKEDAVYMTGPANVVFDGVIEIG